MTTIGSRGHLAFALQASKIGAGAFTPGSYTWQRHRARQISFGVQDLVEPLPLEIGGGLFTDVTYKNGVFLAGQYAIEARLDGPLGYLLQAVAGGVTDVAPTGTTVPRVTTFGMNSGGDDVLPWMTIRKYTPATDNSGSDGQTEYGVDCRVTNLTLTIPQMGPMMAEFGFVGRRPIAIDGESVTGASFPDRNSLAHACKTEVTLTDFAGELPAGGAWTGAQVIVANQFTPPTQEMVLGSYYPDDFVPLSRAAAVRLIYKWPDAKLYRKLLYGVAGGGGQREWTPVIQSSEVTIEAASSILIPTFDNDPYKLRFNAPNVQWSMSAPQLASQQMVQVELIGTVLQAASGSSWTIDLENNTDYIP